MVFNSNFSNNKGEQELAFIISETKTSNTKYIMATDNVGPIIGLNNFKSKQIALSYFVYKNVSLTSKTVADYGHITSHYTTSCSINWFYIDETSTYLSVFN